MGQKIRIEEVTDGQRKGRIRGQCGAGRDEQNCSFT